MTPRQLEKRKLEQRIPHGVSGQFNIFVLDRESDVTGYGEHNRLVVFGNPDNIQITLRGDSIGLPSASEKQRQKVLNGWQRQHPRGTTLQLVCCERTTKNTWWYYNVVK